MTVRSVLSFAWLQVGWFSCVLGAAWGHPWVGPGVVLVWLSKHVATRRSPRSEMLVLGASALAGMLVDTAFLRLGVIEIPGVTVSPLWLVALWPNFISTTAPDGPLGSLPRRPIASSLLGAIGGPLAYDAGARLGAIRLESNRMQALALVGVVWAAVVPALLVLRTREWLGVPDRKVD